MAGPGMAGPNEGGDGRPARAGPPVTPDGRYFVVRGRLWRCSDPSIPPDERARLVRELMDARRAVGAAKRAADRPAEAEAHAAVDRAKHSLGERGPAWWGDGAPDLNRRMARNTPYAEWFAALAPEQPQESASHGRMSLPSANDSGAAAVRERGPASDPDE